MPATSIAARPADIQSGLNSEVFSLNCCPHARFATDALCERRLPGFGIAAKHILQLPQYTPLFLAVAATIRAPLAILESTGSLSLPLAYESMIASPDEMKNIQPNKKPGTIFSSRLVSLRACVLFI